MTSPRNEAATSNASRGLGRPAAGFQFVALALFLLASTVSFGASDVGGAMEREAADGSQIAEVHLAESAVMVLEPLSIRIGGAASLDVNLEQVASIATEGWITTVTMQDGLVVAGRARGQVAGLDDEGRALAGEWKDQEPMRVLGVEGGATKGRDSALSPYGLRVSGAGLAALELSDLHIRETWLQAQGTHKIGRELIGPASYTPQEGDVVGSTLAFTLLQGLHGVLEVEVGVDRIESLKVGPLHSEMIVALDGGRVRLVGELGSKVRRTGGSLDLRGETPHGTWTMTPDSWKGAVFETRDGEARLEVEFVGFSAEGGADSTPASAWASPSLGTAVAWDDQVYEVLAQHLAVLQLEIEGEAVELDPADLVSLEVHEDPTHKLHYDVAQSLPATVVAADGRTLEGRLTNRFGYLEVQGPAGVRTYLSSVWIESLELGPGGQKAEPENGHGSVSRGDRLDSSPGGNIHDVRRNDP